MTRMLDGVTLLARRAFGHPSYEIHARHSYSQEGEDLILRRLFDWVRPGNDPGFYVDIGAHHPHRFSNTFMFYLEGWQGLNVDAMPGSMEAFRKERPRDLNVEAAIAESASSLTYYIFNEPALNGFDEKLARERDGSKGFRIVEQRQINTLRLGEVLAENLRPGQIIDFMTVDVEGFDLQVLRSNDWGRYRPLIVLAEEAKADTVQAAQGCAISKYLADNGYELCAKAVHSMFFVDKSRKPE